MSNKQILIRVREFSESSHNFVDSHSSDGLANVVNSADTRVARFEITFFVIHPCDH